MEMHEFGIENGPVVVLLHAFGMHWSMWRRIVDELKDDYRVFVPSLEGHEDENRTTFTTVEHNARAVIDWLEANGCNEIYGLIGVSLGGAIAIDIVGARRLSVANAIFDAGIVPLGKGGFAERLEVASNLLVFYGAHCLPLMKMISLADVYGGPDQIRTLHATMKSISWRTARNVFYGVDSYALPAEPLDVDTRATYWYGSREEAERGPMAERLRKIFPRLTTQVFEGYRHAQLCLGDPERFVASARRFFAGDELS
jgi:pimeloyl-ACP methyl ester carboxylesterase